MFEIFNITYSNNKMETQSVRRESKNISSDIILNNCIVNHIVSKPEDCVYFPFFCEENIWHLCDYVRRNKSSELNNCNVVFISNNSRCVSLLRQKSGQDAHKLVIWDYHVIFVYTSDSGEDSFVFDFDSDLEFPTHFHKYVAETFRPQYNLRPEFNQYFRVIPAATYLQRFASDRRHMKNTNGKWIQNPPETSPIRCSDSIHNIDDFISMDPKKGHGIVLSLQEFANKFNASK